MPRVAMRNAIIPQVAMSQPWLKSLRQVKLPIGDIIKIGKAPHCIHLNKLANISSVEAVEC